MCMGVRSVWGPGGRLNWESSPKHTGSGVRTVAGLCRDQHRSQLRRMDAAWVLRGQGLRAVAALGWWVLRKAPKGHWSPPRLAGHTENGKLIKAISPVLGDHKVLEWGAECLWIPLAPLESEDPGSHRIKPFGSNRFDFYFFFQSGYDLSCQSFLLKSLNPQIITTIVPQAHSR